MFLIDCLFIAFLNKVNVIYDALDTNTEPGEESFNDMKEVISYGYNYYLYLSNLVFLKNLFDRSTGALKFLLISCLLVSNMQAHNILIEAKTAAYFPTSSQFKNIYNKKIIS